jgi:hypothetical protein
MAENTCTICFCNYEPEFFAELPCTHKFCYFCLKGTMNTSNYLSCPLCRRTIPIEFFEHFTKIVKKEDLDNVTKYQSKWMYSGRNGGWWFYQKECDELIEKAWINYQNSLSSPENVIVDDQSEFNLMINGSEYNICFITMKQKSIRNNWHTRKIKREENAKIEDNKGIGGIRYIIDKNSESNDENSEDITGDTSSEIITEETSSED